MWASWAFFVVSGRPTTDSHDGIPAAAVAIILPVLLMAPLVSVSKAQNTGASGVFTEVEPEPSAPTFPETPSSFANLAETPGVSRTRIRLVRVVFDQLASARADALAMDTAGEGARATLTLNLFEDVVLSAVVERATPTASGTGYALSGRIDADDLGAMTLVVYGDTVAGTVSASAGTFTIHPVGDGVHAISQVDVSTLPPPGEPRASGPGGRPAGHQRRKRQRGHLRD